MLTSCLRRFAPNRTPIALGFLVMVSLCLMNSVGWAVTGFPQFYESVVSKNCSASSCLINLGVVPTGTVLQATHIACSFNTAAGNPIPVLRVSLLQGPFPSAPFKEAFFVNAVDPTSTNNTFIFHQDIRTFFAAGHRPLVEIAADAIQITMTCKISGDIIRT